MTINSDREPRIIPNEEPCAREVQRLLQEQVHAHAGDVMGLGSLISSSQTDTIDADQFGDRERKVLEFLSRFDLGSLLKTMKAAVLPASVDSATLQAELDKIAKHDLYNCVTPLLGTADLVLLSLSKVECVKKTNINRIVKIWPKFQLLIDDFSARLVSFQRTPRAFFEHPHSLSEDIPVFLDTLNDMKNGSPGCTVVVHGAELVNNDISAFVHPGTVYSILVNTLNPLKKSSIGARNITITFSVVNNSEKGSYLRYVIEDDGAGVDISNISLEDTDADERARSLFGSDTVQQIMHQTGYSEDEQRVRKLLFGYGQSTTQEEQGKGIGLAYADRRLLTMATNGRRPRIVVASHAKGGSEPIVYDTDKLFGDRPSDEKRPHDDILYTRSNSKGTKITIDIPLISAQT